MGSQDKNSNALDTIKFCYDALIEKKAEDILVLDVRDKSNITDYFIIATGTSEPHLKAIQEILKDVLKGHKVSTAKTDYEPGSGWIVIDLFDVMIHVFTAEQRDFYRLDLIWKDAEPVDPTTLS